MTQWGLLTSEEFESLALAYAQYHYQDYTWKPTRLKGDDNHDFYYIEIDDRNQEWEGWGEAKHSNNINKTMSREKWDQTIISGQLANNVKHLMFVTNAKIPIEYILRAECLKAPPYEKFEYINNNILENWLYNNPRFIPSKLQSSFDYNPFNIIPKIKFKFFIIDYFSMSRNILNEPDEIYACKDYLLFIIIDSNYVTQLSFIFSPTELIQISPYDIVDLDYISIDIGLNCIKCIIRFFTHAENCTLKLIAFDKIIKKTYSTKKTFQILENFTPYITYSKQLETYEKLFDMLSEKTIENNLFTLFANKGVGKTYLLRLLFKEYRLYNQLLFLTCTENPTDCTRNLCILFLAVNFGIDYTDTDCWNKILVLYKKLPEKKKKLSLHELKKIYEGSKMEDSAASILAYDILESFLLENTFDILDSGMRKYITLIIDDIHKIPEKYGVVFSEFIKQFCTNNTYGKLLLAGREHEFNSETLRTIVQMISKKKYYLQALSLEDKIKSLQYNFTFIKRPEYYSGLLNRCTSTMLFCVLLHKIKKFVEKEGENEPALQMQLSQIFKQIGEEDNALAREEFLHYKKDFSLIFLIYAYQSGLNIQLFKDEEDIDMLNRIHQLIKTDILEKQGNYILPAHDIYQGVFKKLCHSSLFSSEKEKAANFLFNHLESPYVDKFRALPVLLILGEKYKEEYLKESIALMNSYYKSTEYGKMNLLCKKIIEQKYPDWDSCIWDKEKLWLFYLYADCLDHCGSLQKSKKYFLMVYENGLPLLEDDSLDFLWDAKAQIFNIRYSLLDTANLLEEMDDFLTTNVAKIKSSHTASFETAYLNSLNRRMVTTLLMDNYDEADVIAEKYIKLSNELGNESHQAYYYIDYARGIYYQNPLLSLEYINIAYERFKDLDYEKRRLIDCESELRYLECVLNHKEIKLLDKVSDRINENGYTHMYINSLLKRAAIRIRQGDLRIAQNLLLKVSTIFDLEQFPRVKLLFSNLMSAIYFIEDNQIMMEKYIKIQNNLATNIGKSYQNLREIDSLKTGKVDFNCMPGVDYFPLETRLW